MYDFEIHITTKDVGKDQIAAYENFCQSIKAKPIIIELSEGEYYQQPMISKVVKCNSQSQLEQEIKRLEEQFVANDYPVLRTKIEVPFWHKEAVSSYYENESQTYYEWHGKVLLNNEDLIKEISHKYGGRLSKNALKNNLTTKFITLRDYKDEAAIKQRIDGLKKELATYDLELKKEELEYCIYDSNELLDKGWIL